MCPQEELEFEGKPRLSQCFPILQFLGMLFRKRSSSFKSGNSWIFQRLHFRSADVCRILNYVPGAGAELSFHMAPCDPWQEQEDVPLPCLTGVAPEGCGSSWGPPPLKYWPGTRGLCHWLSSGCWEARRHAALSMHKAFGQPHGALYRLNNPGETLAWVLLWAGHFWRWSA